MPYQAIFTLHGNILHQNGNKYPFRDNLIDTIIRRNEKVIRIQGESVFYRIREGIVFLCIGEDCVDGMVCEYFSRQAEKKEVEVEKEAQEENKEDNTKHDTKQDTKDHFTKHDTKHNNLKNSSSFQKKKSRKWHRSSSELDYSCSTVTDHLLESPRTISLFSNFKQKFISQFNKQFLTTHLLNKNVSIEVVNHLLKDCTNLNELKQNIRNLIKIKKLKKNTSQLRIALVGPNGVGKSTTLSKLCYIFCTKHNYSVYVCAADTFRAGAIEQLKVYINRLKENNYKIELHSEGYKKEESKVTLNAFNKIKNTKTDIFIVDTAGRTTDKKLMDSLKKLIQIDLNEIIYVNEALKGNTKDILFFKEFITGIIITKMDTVADRIGGILNLCYFGEKPVVYVTYGQSNVEIEELDVEKVIEVILSV